MKNTTDNEGVRCSAWSGPSLPLILGFAGVLYVLTWFELDFVANILRLAVSLWCIWQLVFLIRDFGRIKCEFERILSTPVPRVPVQAVLTGQNTLYPPWVLPLQSISERERQNQAMGTRILARKRPRSFWYNMLRSHCLRFSLSCPNEKAEGREE